MTPEKTTLAMVHKLTAPQTPLYVVSVADMLSALAVRIGRDAFKLTAGDLQQACDEVQAVFTHCLDEQEYIRMGLDVWEHGREPQTQGEGTA